MRSRALTRPRRLAIFLLQLGLKRVSPAPLWGVRLRQLPAPRAASTVSRAATAALRAATTASRAAMPARQPPLAPPAVGSFSIAAGASSSAFGTGASQADEQFRLRRWKHRKRHREFRIRLRQPRRQERQFRLRHDEPRDWHQQFRLRHQLHGERRLRRRHRQPGDRLRQRRHRHGQIRLGNRRQRHRHRQWRDGHRARSRSAPAHSPRTAARRSATAPAPGRPSSVAIGAGSVASAPNTVSFGSPGAERRLTNIAPGISPTDAATWGQVTDINQEARRGLGAMAALSTPLTPSAPGKTSVAGHLRFLPWRNRRRPQRGAPSNTAMPLVVQGGWATDSKGYEYVGRVGRVRILTMNCAGVPGLRCAQRRERRLCEPTNR